MEKGNNQNNKTILIETESGNNLASIYLRLTSKALKEEFNIHKVLDNIIITRAFTFYHLANIIINEIPKLIDKLNCNIQVIVVDLLETLFSSSFFSNKRNRNDLKDFYENEKLLNEIVDDFVHISDKHFVIVTYEDIDNWTKRTMSSKFKNIVEMNKVEDVIKVKKHNKDTDIQMKIE
jgi:hypothetical protein